MKPIDRWLEECTRAILADFHAYHVRSGEDGTHAVCGLDAEGAPVVLIECCHDADAALVCVLLSKLKAIHHAAH